METSKIPKVSLTSRGSTANPSSLAAITDFWGNALSKYLKKECNFGIVSYFNIFACCGLAVLVTLARRAAITDFSRNGLSKYLKNECNFVF